MARHRNYRNYAYEDDMSDDVYGHSVEDYDMAVSPTTAEQFMFRRTNSRDPNLSAYMADRFGRVDEEDEEESEEEPLASSQDYRRPQLDPKSEAKLLSCLDQLHSILGENLHEQTAVEAVIHNNFDLERALDQMLNQGGKQNSKANSEAAGSKDSIPCKTLLCKNYKQSGHRPHSQQEITENNPTETGTDPCSDDTELANSSVLTSAGSPSDMQDNSSLVSQAMTVHKVSENIPHTTPLSSLSDQPAHGSLGVVQSASDSSLSPSAGVPLSNKPAFLSSMYPTQNTSQDPLFSGTLQCEGSSSRTPEEVSSLGLSQPISQSSFISVPLSSLSQAVDPQWTSPSFGPSHTASDHPLLSVPLSSLSQFGDLASGQQGMSAPSPLLYSSEHAPLSGSALGQPGTSFMLGPSCASSSGPLLSAPLSSLSQSGGLSSHVTSQNPLLSVPLSSLSQQCGQSGTATPSGPSQMASQSPLLSVPLSSLSQSGSLQCGQLGRIPSLPGSSQTISQSHLPLVPLSSLTHSGSVPSHQMATAASLGPSQNPLLSVPLSSLSKSGSSQTGHLGTLSSLIPPQATSQSPLLSVSLSSLSKSGSSQTGHLGTLSSLIPPQATSQSPLLSVSLSSLSQSESMQTGQLGTLPSLGSSQTSSQSPLLSIPLSSLSQSGSVQSGQLGAVSSLNPSQGTSSSLSGSLLTGQPGRLSSSGFSMVHDSGASDPSCLKENLEGLKIVGDDARGVPVEKDFNHNQKRKQKQKPATLAVKSPTLGSISGQTKIKEKTQFSTDVPTYQGIGMGSYGHRQPKIMATGEQHRPQLTSSPSMFALTLSCAVSVKQSFASKSDAKSDLEGFCEQLHTASDIIPFDFSSPSPDDAVRKRQKGVFARKK